MSEQITASRCILGSVADQENEASEPDNEPRLWEWERLVQTPMIVLAFVFLAAYAIPIVWPEIPANLAEVCLWTTWIIWVIYAVEYLIRLGLAEHRWTYFKRNIFDLIVVVLPIFRPLHALRAVTVLALAAKKTKDDSRVRTTVYVVAGAFMITIVAALEVTEAEQGVPDTNIDGIGDGMWWAMTTMSTVGYGDTFPQSVEGRVAGVFLMFTGVAVLGVVTASLAGWFMERAEAKDGSKRGVASQLLDLRVELAELRGDMTSLLSTLAAQQDLDGSGTEEKDANSRDQDGAAGE